MSQRPSSDGRAGRRTGLPAQVRRLYWNALLPLRRFLGDRLLGKVLFHIRVCSGEGFLFGGRLDPGERRYLFEPRFYASQYLGALQSRKGLAAHFLAYGVVEGAWPSPLFDPEYYLRQYPDAAASRLNPLTHYVLYGAREGRNPHPLFDTSYYLSQLGEEAHEVEEPVGHFMKSGRFRGLRCHPTAPDHAFAGPYEALCETGFRAGVSMAAKAEAVYWPGHSGPDAARKAFASLDEEAAAFQQGERERWLQELGYQPDITVLVPAFRVQSELLVRLATSVDRQIYPHWEAVLTVERGAQDRLSGLLRQAAPQNQQRFKVLATDEHSRAAALNAALELASGEYVCVADPEDVLAPFALLEAARALQGEPRADAVYTDSDVVDARGRLSNPVCRPAWSPELLRHEGYIGRLWFARRELVKSLGGFDPAFEGAEEYELLLRLSERTQLVRHAPEIACHCGQRSAGAAPSTREELRAKRARAVREHLARCGVNADVKEDPSRWDAVLIEPRLGEVRPLVSVIIPTRNQAGLLSQCLESIYQKTTYQPFEVILVDNGTDEPDALALHEKYPVRVISYLEPFNFSRANNLAAAEARGEILVLLNNDTEVVSPGWLEQMVFYAQMAEVGAVGALLLYGDGKIQHAGVALGTRGTPHHILRGTPAAEAEKSGWLSAAREVTAVTGACMMVKRRDYEQLGGLREFFQDIYQDVDFCLRLLKLGRRNILTPRARLLHHESLTRGARRELRDRVLFVELWRDELAAGDRYFRAGAAGRQTLEP